MPLWAWLTCLPHVDSLVSSLPSPRTSPAEWYQHGPGAGQSWLEAGPDLSLGCPGSWGPGPFPLSFPRPRLLLLSKWGARQQGSFKGSHILCSEGIRRFNNLDSPFPTDALSRAWTGVWRVFLPPLLSVMVCVDHSCLTCRQGSWVSRGAVSKRCECGLSWDRC